jgi:hypothetical protein
MSLFLQEHLNVSLEDLVVSSRGGGSLRISKEITKRKSFSTHLRTRKLRAELILLTINFGINASMNG